MKKGSLKKSLSSTQARLKKKKQVEDATAHQQQAKGVTGKGTAKVQNPRPSTVPFKESDRILLIGEGNFSFAVALLQHPPAPLEHLPSANITATALDTEEECHTKYPDAEQNVRALREKGTQVLFGVDATKLEKTPALKGKVFDRIVWNFPHAGECVPMAFLHVDALMGGRARKGKASRIRTEIYCLTKFSSSDFFVLRQGTWSADLHRNYNRPASVPPVMTSGRITIRRLMMGALEEPSS
jgi:hypothetical protein